MKKIRLRLLLVLFFMLEFVQNCWEHLRRSYASDFLIVSSQDQFVIKDCYFVIDPSMERGISVIGWSSEEISSS